MKSVPVKDLLPFSELFRIEIPEQIFDPLVVRFFLKPEVPAIFNVLGENSCSVNAFA